MSGHVFFKRKAYAKLLEWKNRRAGKTAVLIEGARRVGKTTLAREFAANEYESYLVIDFSDLNPNLRRVFDECLNDRDEFFRRLQLETGTRLYERRSLIVFDEVQLYPRARQAIKHLVADGRYDYIETGSLVSIKRNVRDILIPSEEEKLELGPFDFDEFLLATGQFPGTPDLIADCLRGRETLDVGLHRKLMELFQHYVIVGGMPQAVEEFARSGDLGEVDDVKRGILDLYRNDIAKFGDGDSRRIYDVFESIPDQLSRPNKIFNFALAERDARHRDLMDALQWLDEAKFVNRCYRVSEPNVMIRAYRDPDQFKAYFVDTGLLTTLAFQGERYVDNAMMRDVLRGKIGVNRGLLMENVVAQMLTAAGHPLFHWSTGSNGNRYEVDFLLVRPYEDAAERMRVSPVEVKSSGRHMETRSLDLIRERFGREIGKEYVLSPKPMDTSSPRRVRLPLYMSGLL